MMAGKPATDNGGALASGLAGLGAAWRTAQLRRAETALKAGELEVAWSAASGAGGRTTDARERALIADVGYAYAKHLMPTDLRASSRVLSEVRDLVPDREMVRLRWKAAARALSRRTERDVPSSEGQPMRLLGEAEVRRWDVISFAQDVGGRLNYSISAPSPTPLLDYVARYEILRQPAVPLPELHALDAYLALGTYRWAGDQQRNDEFSEWVRRMKRGDERVARHLGTLLAEGLGLRPEFMRDTDLVVAVPPDPRREAERGFSPPSVLADQVGEVLGIPVHSGALRKRAALRARHLAPADVRRNYEARMSARPLFQGSTVLLIDDVATRGCTLAACAAGLHGIGAAKVRCAVLAQSVTTYKEASAAEVY